MYLSTGAQPFLKFSLFAAPLAYKKLQKKNLLSMYLSTGAPPFLKFSLRSPSGVREEDLVAFLGSFKLILIGGGEGGWGGDQTLIWPAGAVGRWDAEARERGGRGGGGGGGGGGVAGERGGVGSGKEGGWGTVVLYVGLESPQDICGVSLSPAARPSSSSHSLSFSLLLPLSVSLLRTCTEYTRVLSVCSWASSRMSVCAPEYTRVLSRITYMRVLTYTHILLGR